MHASEKIAVGIFLFAVLSVYVTEASFFIRYFLARIYKSDKKPKLLGKPAIALHAVAVLGIFCMLYGYFIEPYWIEVTNIPIKTTKLKKTSFRIVQISDLHCEMKIRNEEKLAGIINPLKPDIIIFTGDSLNVSGALPLFRKTLAGLEAKLCKFAVNGNFDVSYWRELDLFKGTGFVLLKNRVVTLSKGGERISIFGTDPGQGALDRANPGGFDGETFNVFLYHYPGLIEEVAGRTDLYLCGHTHGGQVALPFYGALVTLAKYGKKYEAGRYEVGGTVLYVNRGIGMEPGPVPSVRFWARPEITVFDIVPEK